MALLILAVPFWYFCLYAPPLRISKETTHVTGPMMSDGKRIDYFRAFEEKFYPPEIATEQNGYRLFVESFGDFSQNERQKNSDPAKAESLRRQVYEKLGLDPSAPPKCDTDIEKWSAERVIENDEQRKRNGVELHGKLTHDTWTLEEYPFMAEWVEASAESLDIIAEAVRKPVFYFPLVRSSEDDSADVWILAHTSQLLQLSRAIARTLSVRANYRRGIGDIDGAIDDKISCLRLGRHVGNQGVLVHSFVGIAIEQVGWSMPVDGGLGHSATAEQLARLQRETESLPPRVTFAECMERERLYGLASIQTFLFGGDGYPPNVVVPALARTLAPIRWAYDPNVVMQRLNSGYDAMITNPQNPSEHKIELTNWFWLMTVRGRSETMADLFKNTFVSASLELRETFLRSACVENLSRLNLALLRYEREHGSLPDGDWRVAILPYLGEGGEKYLQCPSAKLADGETTYALVDRRNLGTPYSFTIVEILPPQKLGEGNGRIASDNAKRFVKPESNETGLCSNHPGGCNTAHASGSVRFTSQTAARTETLTALADGTATDYPP